MKRVYNVTVLTQGHTCLPTPIVRGAVAGAAPTETPNSNSKSAFGISAEELRELVTRQPFVSCEYSYIFSC